MRKFLVLMAVVFSLSSVANAQFQKGNFDFNLSGGGASDKSLHNTSISGTVGIGYFFASDLEIGVRQNVAYNAGFGGNTTAFVDYNFNFGKLVPFIGASGGYEYGSIQPNRWNAGPEIGLRYFLTSDAYAFGSASYQFDVNQGVSTGGFQYNIGVGVRF